MVVFTQEVIVVFLGNVQHHPGFPRIPLEGHKSFYWPPQWNRSPAPPKLYIPPLGTVANRAVPTLPLTSMVLPVDSRHHQSSLFCILPDMFSIGTSIIHFKPLWNRLFQRLSSLKFLDHNWALVCKFLVHFQTSRNMSSPSTSTYLTLLATPEWTLRFLSI